MVSQEKNDIGKALFSAKPAMKTGPFILGFFFDAILFGVFFMNFVRWLRWSQPQEKLIIKLLVYWLFIHSCGYSIFLVSMNFKFFVLHFGEWGVFFDLDFLKWTFLLETISRTPVSIFFAARAYRLSGRSKVFIAILAPLFLASSGGAIWARIVADQLFVNTAGNAPIFLWMGAEVASDLVITIFISYHLFKSRTGWKQTDRMITKLMVLVIETQLPPTFFATFYLIFTGVPSVTQLASFFSFMPNTYAITTLIVLNKRYALRREFDNETTTSKRSGVDRRVLPAGNIHVVTEVLRHVEEPLELTLSREKKSDEVEGQLSKMDESVLPTVRL